MAALARHCVMRHAVPSPPAKGFQQEPSCPSKRTHLSRQTLSSSTRSLRSSPLHPAIPRQQGHPLLGANLGIRIHHPRPLPLLLARALVRSRPILGSRAGPDAGLGHPNKLVDVVATRPLPRRVRHQIVHGRGSAAGVTRRGAVVEVGRRRGRSARGSGGQLEGRRRRARRRRPAGWEGGGRWVGLRGGVRGRAGGGVGIALLWRGERSGLFVEGW